MTQPNSVPQLDLAPQLNRPLSLWNPFDYLRFLYWIFFFPQALRWYEEQYLIDNKSNQIKLWIQGLILTAIIPLSICKAIEEIGYSINWSAVYFGIVLGVVIVLIVQRWRKMHNEERGDHLWIVYSIASSMVYSGLLSIAYGMLPDLGLAGFLVWLGLGICLGLILEVWFGWELDLAYTLPSSLKLVNFLTDDWLSYILTLIVLLVIATYNLFYGSLVLMVFAFSRKIYIARNNYKKSDLSRDIFSSLLIGILFYCILKICYSLSGLKELLLSDALYGFSYFLAFYIIFFAVLTIIITRLDNWIMGSILNYHKIKNKSFLFPRITSVPLPFLTSRLTTWLRQDWLLGLHNANELLRYSHQFIPVVKAVNQVLHEMPPEHLVFRVSQLATNPNDWQIVKYASVSLSKQLKTGGIERDTRLDTPPHAIAAGFWYLHEQEPDKAMDAFETVRSFPYGEEMFILAQTLYQLQKATNYSKYKFLLYDYINLSEPDEQAKLIKKLKKIAAVKLPIFPSEPLLRPTTWQALNSLRSVILDLQFIVGKTSESTYNAALNRAIHKLQTILDNGDAIPEAEQQLIVNLTLEVKAVLDEITSKY